MNLYRTDRPLDVEGGQAPLLGDICLDRYPRDLGRALALAECGQVSAGHTVLVAGLVDARARGHEPLQRVYQEALEVYETRYTVARN